MIEERSFSAGPVNLNYVWSGPSGPPLVLLHGITNRWEVFLNLMPYLTQRWRVFALDLRGHGRSGHVRDGYAGEQISQDVIQFLEQAVGEPAVLYGHSLGGMVTTYIASQRPELVRAAGLGDSPFFQTAVRESALPEMFVRVHELLLRRLELPELVRALGEMPLRHPHYGEVLFKNIPFNDEAYLHWWARSLQAMDPQVLEMSLDGRMGAGWNSDWVKSIRCPLLVLQADPKWGGLVTQRDVDAARQSNPRTVHVLLSNVGHSLHIHQPRPVMRALGNWLGSL